MRQKITAVEMALASFGKAIDDQVRQDVMDLMLYADISASEKYDKNQQASRWMNYYQNRIIKFGCTLEAFIVPDMVIVSDLQGFNEIDFKMQGGTGSAELVELVNNSFSKLQINKRAIDFFRGYSGSERTVMVNITSCELTKQGRLLLLFCGVILSSSIEVKQFFFDSETFYDLTVQPNGGAFLFDQAKYALHREDIIRKLDEAASDAWTR